jgi:hypothetical protein
LPGKPLADIAGLPMVVHVARRAQASGAVATLFCSFASGQWHHVAMMRSGGTGYLFLNGFLAAATVSVSGTNNWTTAAICNASTPLFVAEVRFTTAARYATSGFLAPRGAFPDR